MKVTVIVPCYNHREYLPQRLETIYGQRYEDFDVILLDDASTDGSREVLAEYAHRYPEKTKVLFNDVNSGCPFDQWQKGITAASGELIWIAESDDYSELDFLAKMALQFRDELVMLAYSTCHFMNNSGERIWTTQEYLAPLSSDRWNSSHINSAHDEVQFFFSSLNLVSNVSCAVFRNQTRFAVFDNPVWRKMKVCGDWIFYLSIIRGGRVAFVHDVINYYRVHATNTSRTNIMNELYYRELFQVGVQLLRWYNVRPQSIENLWNKAHQDFSIACPDRDPLELTAFFPKQELLPLAVTKKLSIGMCGLAFVSGGGETFPIKLANELYRAGQTVTFININYFPTNNKVRAMLEPGVPVANLQPGEEMSSYINELGINLLHSHHGGIDYMVAQQHKRSKFRQVVTNHGYYEAITESELTELFDQLIGGVDSWVYTTNKNLDPFRKRGHYPGLNFHKIGNAIEPLPYAPMHRDQFGIPPSAFLVTLISRAVPEKGWKRAIECVEEARRITKRDVRLLLVGDGPLYEELSPNNLFSFTHFAGFQENVKGLYEMSDLAFLPTCFKGESFPLVLLESLYVGVPIVASDVGEIREMLSSASGELAGEVFQLSHWDVPVDDVAKVLSRFVLDKDFLNRKRILAKECSGKFVMRRVAENYIDVYNEALGKV